MRILQHIVFLMQILSINGLSQMRTNFLFNQRNDRPQMAPIDDSESPLHTTTLSGSDGAKLH